jgi:hypothetical protein
MSHSRLKKNITLGDIITLDRAVQRDTRSVVYFITQIDPSEGETDTEKLRKVISRLEESMRANEIKQISDACLLNYFRGAIQTTTFAKASL